MSLNGFNMILAQAAPAAAPQGNQGSAINMLFFLVIFGIIFYVLMIRPQSKKAKEHAALLQTLKPGDKVVTSAGVVGTVVSVKDRTVAIRSADTKMEVLKSSVSEITERSGESSSEESKS